MFVKVWKTISKIGKELGFWSDAQAFSRPRILVALDRSWMHRFGFTRFTYSRLIRRYGGVPVKLDSPWYQEIENVREVARDLLNKVDALILSGGGDVEPKLYGSTQAAKQVNPNRDRFELALLQEAIVQKKPVLGICRGCQLLNVAFGGTLRSLREDETLSSYHNRVHPHEVQIEPNSYMARILGISMIKEVRSLHGQAVDRLGKDIRVSAYANDRVYEAIERKEISPTNWAIGVQWHPELMFFGNEEYRLFEDFIECAFLCKQNNNFHQKKSA